VNNYKVENGVLKGTNNEARRRIESARNLPGDGSNYMSLTNVQRASAILTEDLWNHFFPNALPVYTYENFLKAIAKFPKFCNDHATSTQEADLEEACKIELSTFLAHMKQEVADLIYVTEIRCTDTDNWGCDYSQSSSLFPPTAGRKYFGRGPFQLSWNYNYAQFSTVAFNGGLDDMQILLDNPDMVATDGKLAFMSALWFYMYPQSPKPSMHDAILGLYQTNSVDDGLGICSGCFGSTINIINGGIECGQETAQATNRVSYYDWYCTTFRADCPQEGKTCEN